MKKLISLALALLLVLGCLSGLSFAADAEAKWTDGSATAEGTLAEMAKQASSKGGTVTLLKDINHTKDSYAVSSDSAFTMDLNGHTITSEGGGVCVTNNQKGIMGTFVVKNGTIIAKNIAVSCNKGGLQMKDLNVYSEKKQSVIYNEVDGKYFATNLIEGCTIISAAWGSVSFNRTDGQSQGEAGLVIRNSNMVSLKTKTSSIVKQAKAVAANIVLAEGVKLFTLEEKTKTPIDSGINVTGETATKQDGTFSISVGDKTFDNLYVWATPATATVAVEVPKVEVKEETKAFQWSNGISTVECTAKEAMAQVNANGGTVKLLADASVEVSTGYCLTANKPFTLDLNGKTLTTNNFGLLLSEKHNGVTQIIDSVGGGKMIGEKAVLTIKGGGVHVKGVTLWSTKAQTINHTVAEDTWNHENLIEDCVVGTDSWCCFSFNSTTVNQEKASMTFKNSTLINTTKSNLIDLQNKPEGSKGNIVFGEGMKMYTYKTAGSAYGSALTLLGEEIIKGTDPVTVTVNGKTYEGIVERTTSATATVDLSKEIPGAKPAETPAEPATPATPAEPEKPAETEKPAEDKKEEGKRPVTPVVEEVDEGGSAGLIIAIVAAVAVIAVVAVVVLKKKKK